MKGFRDVFVGLLALSAVGCAAAMDGSGEPLLGVAEALDANGEPIVVEVLDGSSVSAQGATFDVRVEGTRYVVHADVAAAPAFYWVANGSGELLVAATVDEDFVEVTSVEGQTVRSETGGVCDALVEAIDGVPYRLITSGALAAMQDVVVGARSRPTEGEVGGAREALSYSIGGVYGADQCPGVSCESEWGNEKCCCGVNKKCVRTKVTCSCKDATSSYVAY